MLNFALIGCGRIAKRHSELLGHRQIAGARLSAVCDVVPERAEAIGRQFDVPHYSDMHEMMRREQIDVVSVLTESGMHAEHVLALARHRRHIVVEKPMALTLRDADRMIAATSSQASPRASRLAVPIATKLVRTFRCTASACARAMATL